MTPLMRCLTNIYQVVISNGTLQTNHGLLTGFVRLLDVDSMHFVQEIQVITKKYRNASQRLAKKLCTEYYNKQISKLRQSSPGKW